MNNVPIHIAPLDSSVVGHFWPAAAPLIAAALSWSRDRWTLDSIKADLDSGDKRLWVVFRGKEMISAYVTVNTDFPEARVCTILACGGTDAASWVEQVLTGVESAAIAEGCTQVEIIGRPGWRRLCAGYDHAGDWLVKNLEAS